MDFQLKGRVAAITGASSGLGRRFALELSEEGAAVAVMARATRFAPTRIAGSRRSQIRD